MEEISKEHKKEILKRIEEAGDSENYEPFWDEKGIPKSKRKSEIKKGRTARAKGAGFELKARRDLESKGRIVDKWSNNVDLKQGKLVAAKRKYNPFKKMLVVGTGFPDFISFKQMHKGAYSIIGVEVKTNGVLSKEEKEKCVWYLKNEIFSSIWIAKRGEKRGEILYDDFKEKYGKKYFRD